ncbi:MAG: DNA lyase [Bacteroidetes bacterium]|nr:DNA lyase [Bacteroidota bacterium]
MNPDEKQQLLHEYNEHRDAIGARLEAFRSIPRGRWFYEMAFCLLTPQSSARQCFLVAEELERRNFLHRPFDPAPLLRSHEGGYVRFHNTKAQRLLEAREAWPRIDQRVQQDMEHKQLRTQLAESVKGLGFKEASHFLRNIGRTQVTIIDRHILRNLVRLGVLPDWPPSISRRRYLEIEAFFEDLASTLGIPADELDLLLWRRETGFLLK